MTGWDAPSRAAADLIRVAGVVSFAVATERGFVATALWALVLLGLTLLRVVPAPPLLDLATGVLLVGAAWCSLLDAYIRYAWLDVPVHAAATGLVAGAAYQGLVSAEILPDLRPTPPGPLPTFRPTRAWWGVLVTVASLGLALGVLWEIGEWFGHSYLDPHIQVGYRDTIGDLASGGAGSLVAGLLLARAGRRSAHRSREATHGSRPQERVRG